MIDKHDKFVTGNHVVNCQKCNKNISLEKNHTHAKLYEQFGVCLCNSCAVEVLKEYGHFTEGNGEDKKNLNFLEQKELVIVAEFYDNNNRVDGL